MGDPLSAHHRQDLNNKLQESSLTQFVQHPTRRNNVLDLVFARKEEIVENMNVGDVFCNSEQRAITFSVNFHKLWTTQREADWRCLRDTNEINVN